MKIFEKISYRLWKAKQKFFLFWQCKFKYKAKCVICKKKHERRTGWAHILKPICLECDSQLEKQLQKIMGNS